MIALKIIGAVLILVSGYMFGKHIRDDMTDRSNFIFYMNKALAFIENKIAIENAYLEDILMQSASEIYKDKNIPNPFSCVCKRITESSENIVDAWNNTVESLFGELIYIKEEEKEYIYQIGICLSLPDKTRQTDSIRTIIDNLEQIEKKASEKAKKDGKMAMQISIICAILLIILII